MNDRPLVTYRFGFFELDPLRMRLLQRGEPCMLRPQSVAVLLQLLASPRQLVRKQDLFKAVWGDAVVTDDSLVQCIGEIRRALGENGMGLVRTVPRQGYIFTGDVTQVADAPPVATGEARDEVRPTTIEHPQAGAAKRPPRALLRGWRLWLGLACTVLIALPALWHVYHPAHLGPSRGKISLVVLPLVNLGSNADDDYLADALTDDLTNDLSRLPESFVIARSTAFAYKGRSADVRALRHELGVSYALEGSVRREGEGVRINLQLVDTASGAQRWSERLDIAGTELQTFQYGVTGQVARALQLSLVDLEAARATHTIRPDAHDLAMRGWSAWERRTQASNREARALFERALEADPRSVFAWVGLANTHHSDIGNRWTSDRAHSIVLAEEAVGRALAIDPNHPSVNGSWGTALFWRGKVEAAEKAFERQIAINRNYAPAHYWLSITHAALGRPSQALARVDAAIALSPRDPRLNQFYTRRAQILLQLERPQEALDWARRAVALKPEHAMSHAVLASAAMQSGDTETARTAAAAFRALLPNHTVARLRSESAAAERERPDLVRHWAALREAGIPE